MNNELRNKAFSFVSDKNINIDNNFYCETRDIFQARLDKLTAFLLLNKDLKEDDIYILSAISGEIGNNSFDHNLGSWPGRMGVFFGYAIDKKEITIVLADAGQGVFNTLVKVKPEIKDHKEALKVAFNEKISGRAPEPRGNGLKFVKANIKDRGMRLEFISGNAKAIFNNQEKIEEINKNYQGCIAIINFKSDED